MSEVTKYQFFLDTMKFILTLKNTVDETEYIRIVEESIESVKNKKEISNDDELLIRDFLFYLDENTFYDNCMEIYHKFFKYEADFEINFLHFYKLRFLEGFVSMS